MDLCSVPQLLAVPAKLCFGKHFLYNPPRLSETGSAYSGLELLWNNGHSRLTVCVAIDPLIFVSMSLCFKVPVPLIKTKSSSHESVRRPAKSISLSSPSAVKAAATANFRLAQSQSSKPCTAEPPALSDRQAALCLS